METVKKSFEAFEKMLEGMDKEEVIKLLEEKEPKKVRMFLFSNMFKAFMKAINKRIINNEHNLEESRRNNSISK